MCARLQHRLQIDRECASFQESFRATSFFHSFPRLPLAAGARGSPAPSSRTEHAQQPQPQPQPKIPMETAAGAVMIEARELCRAGGALVAAARDAVTAAELEAMFAALHAAAAGKLSSLQVEARLRARCQEQGLWYKWTPGGASMLTWAMESLPEDLLAQSGMCPAESAVMLAATSKRVRGLLGRMHRRLPVAVRVRGLASMESVACGLSRLLAWCSLVTLDLSRRRSTATLGEMLGRRIGAKGVRVLAEVLGQCSSLATLNLESNDIGDEGAGSLAGVLRECSSLATLNLAGNDIGDERDRSLAEVLRQCSSLATLNLAGNDIEAEGARSLAEVLGQCPSLAELNVQHNFIDDRFIAMIETSIGDSNLLFADFSGIPRTG